jgi:hypothetical protein
MNNLQRIVAQKKRKQAFLDRNLDKMRKKQILTWVSGDCLVPNWIIAEIEYGKVSGKVSASKVRSRIIELIQNGIDRSSGLPRLRKSEEDMEDSVLMKIRLGGKIAREIKAWAGKRRVGVADAIVELMIWGTM